MPSPTLDGNMYDHPEKVYTGFESQLLPLRTFCCFLLVAHHNVFLTGKVLYHLSPFLKLPNNGDLPS